MKKIISLVLTVLMIASVLPVAVSANSYFTDVNDNDYFADAAMVLSQVDIISGYADGSFKPQSNITRAEMATIVCRFMGAESTARKHMGMMTALTQDVPRDHWASGFVTLAVDRGIISGDGNGFFRPNDFVTFNEAVKMIVCAAGLDGYVNFDPANWAKGYVEVADRFEITDNMHGARNGYASRGDVAVMIYNALDDNNFAPMSTLPMDTYSSPQYVTLYTESGADIYYCFEEEGKEYDWKLYNDEGFEINETCRLLVVARKNGYDLCSIQLYPYEFDESYKRFYRLTYDYDYTCIDLDNMNENCYAGDTIRLNCQPKSGYIFKEWTATAGEFADKYNPSTTFTMPNEDVVIGIIYTSEWEEERKDDEIPSYWEDDEDEWEEYDKYDGKKYTLTMKMTGCGGIRDFSGKYESGSNIMLYIYPGTEKSFIKWTSTAGYLHNPENPFCMITMPNEDVEVCAVFDPMGATVRDEDGNLITGGNSGSYDEDFSYDSGSGSESDIEKEVARLVNEERAKEGLAPLTLDSKLSDVARAHSKDMAKNTFFDHTNLRGESPFDRMHNAGITYRTAGENIAAGQVSAEEVMISWMNSPGHRANILNPDYKYIGVGYYKGNGRPYWTQCFRG